MVGCQDFGVKLREGGVESDLTKVLNQLDIGLASHRPVIGIMLSTAR